MRHAVVIGGLCALAAPARADVTVWKQDGSYVAVGMLDQVQSRVVNARGAGTTPDGWTVFFRRLRPIISGDVDRDWFGIIEIDFGAGLEGQDLKTSVKAAYIEYSGFEDSQQSSLKIGSLKPAFGREFLTPASRLLIVSQTFNGINWYGTPDMTMGLGLARVMAGSKISSALAVGMMSINQRPDRIWYQSPQNQTNNTDNTGRLVSGRVDFWPVGEMPVEPEHPSELAFDPADMHRRPGWQVLVSVGGHFWWNNNDNNQPTTACPTTNDNVCPNGLTNVRRVAGGELSGSLFGHGFALDAEYQRIHGVLGDGTFTGGLYRNGLTDLNKLSVGAGYMIYGIDVELVASYSLLTATNFPSAWHSSRVGVNWFIREHTLQLSAEATRNTNAYGTTDAYEDIGRVQAQLAW